LQPGVVDKEILSRRQWWDREIASLFVTINISRRALGMGLLGSRMDNNLVLVQHGASNSLDHCVTQLAS